MARFPIYNPGVHRLKGDPYYDYELEQAVAEDMRDQQNARRLQPRHRYGEPRHPDPKEQDDV